MPVGHPKLTDQRAFYVATSRARDTAQLVTDDAHKLAGQLQRATGEREHRIARETGRGRGGKSAARSTDRERSGKESTGKDHGLDRGGERQQQTFRQAEHERAAEPKQKSRDFDMGLCHNRDGCRGEGKPT